MGPMRPGGRLAGWLLLLIALGIAFEARAEVTEVALVFDASAEGLPKEEIRAAVERELGRPVAASSDGAPGELVVLVDAGRLIVRYRTETGDVERYLPTPNDPTDVPLIVSLAAANLVRDQRDGIAPAKSTDAAKAASLALTPTRKSDPPRPAQKPAMSPTLKRHWLGVHAAQDIAFVHGTSVCQRELSEPPDAFWCFYPGTNDPFFHDSQDERGNFDGGPTLATTRLLLSYDFAIIESVSVGTRLGYAFGGGPPADQHPIQTVPPTDRNLLPPGTPGLGGTPFMPVHAELRANYWFLPLTNRWLRAYAGLAFGIAQVDSKHSVIAFDCADPENGGTLDDCVLNEDFDSELEPTPLDAWNKKGRGFVAASGGAVVPLTSELGIVLNVNAMYMFPLSGFVLEPSLGVMASFLDGALVGN